MKRFNINKFSKVVTQGALALALLVLVGCGRSDGGDSVNGNQVTPQGVVGVGVNGFMPGQGVIVPGGASQITFAGQNVCIGYSYMRLLSNNFYPNQPGNIALGGGAVAPGQPGVMSRTNQWGDSISILMQQVSGPDYSLGCAARVNLQGVISLGTQFVQTYLQNTAQAVQGLYLDLRFAGASILGVDRLVLCTTRDQAGSCQMNVNAQL